MSVTEILDSVQYVVNQKGQQIAVQLDLLTWKALRHLLTELIEDENLARFMAEIETEEHLEGPAAWQTYQTYLAEASQ